MLTSLPSILGSREGGSSATVLVAVLAVVAVGCGGPTNPKPTLSVATDTLSAFALNGTLATAPSALDLFTRRVVVADNTLNFDIAFDIDSAGRALVFPPILLSNSFVTARHVGLQRLTMPYDSVTFGFKGGYHFDSSYALAPGQGLMIVTNPIPCALDANPSLYGKVIVDSVNTTTRTVHFRATIDPNCGFRSFHPGIPTF